MDWRLDFFPSWPTSVREGKFHAMFSCLAIEKIASRQFFFQDLHYFLNLCSSVFFPLERYAFMPLQMLFPVAKLPGVARSRTSFMELEAFPTPFLSSPTLKNDPQQSPPRPFFFPLHYHRNPLQSRLPLQKETDLPSVSGDSNLYLIFFSYRGCSFTSKVFFLAKNHTPFYRSLS